MKLKNISGRHHVIGFGPQQSHHVKLAPGESVDLASEDFKDFDIDKHVDVKSLVQMGELELNGKPVKQEKPSEEPMEEPKAKKKSK